MTKKLHGVSFKKRAPRAVKEIKAFAHQAMVRLPSFTRSSDLLPKTKVMIGDGQALSHRKDDKMLTNLS